jgi:4-hydroxy-2-oxoheptanedioate aldolase
MNKKKPSQGIWRILPSSTITEIISESGFNFQIFDLEHGSYDFDTLAEDIKVCQLLNCIAYVRVSGLNKVEIQKCLDLGADGIVFPQLSDYNDFKLATQLIQYPPKGLRGFNPFVRAGKYGFEKIENKIKCIAIIETLQAVEDLDKILSIEDLNMIYIGIYDLSAQMNCIGNLDTPILVEKVNEIISKCVNNSIEVSLMVNNEGDYNNYINKGVNNFVHTVDSFQLKKSFINLINKYS